MRRYALALSRSADTAEDLVQAACERALGAAESFQEGTHFEAWVLRIVRNLWIDRLRRARTAGITVPVEDSEAALAADGEGTALSRLALAEVARHILDLPAEQREVLVLVCVEGLSYRAAGEIAGIPIGTVMSRLARARLRLAERQGIGAVATRLREETGDG